MTEGSKNYIKYILEQESGSTYRKPGIEEPEDIPSKNRKSKQPNPRGRKSPYRGGGAGGRGTLTNGGDEYRPPVPDRESGTSISELSPEIMFGVKSSYKTLHPQDEEGRRNRAQGLDYVKDIAQAYSMIDAADQYLPSIVRLAWGLSNLQKGVKLEPEDIGNMQAGQAAVGSGVGQGVVPSEMGEILKNIEGTTKNLTGGKDEKDKKNQFVGKVLKYSQNLGALDPFNPLLGLKVGFEMLGGKEIIKRTREIGAAQSAGVQSSMGHPSAMGYFGR